MQNQITQYITELNRLFKTGNVTEHSYRPALQRLLENLVSPLQVTNEPKRIACGAPDYIITKGEIPIGYIEAKDIGTDLNHRSLKEQFDRYKQSLNNLIITDYLTFKLFIHGIPSAEVKIGEVTEKGIIAFPAAFGLFNEIIHSFTKFKGDTIDTSEQLSKVMATKAKLMANIIENALNSNNNQIENSLEEQFIGFQEALIPDIKHKDFADMYAQTIAYGMFAASINHVHLLPWEEAVVEFNRSIAAQQIPQSNPFLRRLFQYIAGYDLDERIRWIVDDLADLFNYVDITSIKKEFSKSEHDPIIHFYETFLFQYDPALRKSRGVWYTPQPIVKFIVQAIDDILKSDFAISQGLADSSKINKKQDNGELKEYHKLQILEPAVGTGTFLAEIIHNIYNSFKDKGAWQSYVKDHLIPRLNGFEILMASYAMAHLKMDMVLNQTGYKHSDNERFKIFLTNSLDEGRKEHKLPFAQWLQNEANEASHIKKNVPVMVVVGNPPYSVSTQNKSKFINDLIAIYKQGLNEKNIQPLSDDYIKFIRLGQYLVEENEEGILAYISNNSFIDGLIHRQMRKNILSVFDKIYILDLHGNSKKKETAPNGSKDENVFDIQQGTSINIFIKTSKSSKKNATVYHADLYGLRSYKYNFLLNNTLQSVKWQQLKFEDENYFFVPKDFSLQNEYKNGFKIDELFLISTSGVKTHNDNELVSFSPFSTESRSYSYRPFDNRYIFYDLKKVVRHRYNVMKHFIIGENIGLITCRQQSTFDFQHVFLSKFISDICAVSLQTSETSYAFPLYTYSEASKLYANEIKEARKPNLNENTIKEISKRIKLRFTTEKEETQNTFAPIDVLDYIYAVLHRPKYRERYKEFLKIDFPRVPFPKSAEQFWKLVATGSKLRDLHLMENVEPKEDIAVFPVTGSNIVEQCKYEIKKVFINSTQYFDNVSPEIWNFYIGGYQPAQKWLKDRKNRTLNFDEVIHYRKIIRILSETRDLMKQIDEIL